MARDKMDLPRAIAPRPPGLAHNQSGQIRPHPKRLPSVKAACESCRTRRSKCNGNRPTCEVCALKGTTCEYTTAPGQTRTSAQKELNAQLWVENSSLLEIVWRLQTTSAQEAQEFLSFIRSQEPATVPALQEWLHNRQKSGEIFDLSNSPDTSSNKPPVLRRFTVNEPSPNFECPGSELGDIANRIDNSQAQHWSASVTIVTVKHAVAMFLQSAGMLFHVFSKKQAENLLDDELGMFKQPESTSFLQVLRREINLQRNAQLAELCGMAAVGVLYLRLPGHSNAPPVESAEFFYSTTRLLLDSSIQANPLQAMKTCALLAMYNIVLKGTIALAYIELGLGLGRTHGLSGSKCPPEMQMHEFLDYKKVWRSLFLFYGWLSASLGYVSSQAILETCIPDEEDNVPEGDIIQRELVKITIMKAKIIRITPDESLTDETAIQDFREQLSKFYEQLPHNLSVGSVLDPQKATPLRPNIYYLHLFYLSAMELLHRRVMGNPAKAKESKAARAAILEGLVAATMAARILALMRLEGAIVQICWMCIYLSYTSAIIILHAAAKKLLNGYPPRLCVADLALVDVCVQTLSYCAQVDHIAGIFEQTICRYLHALQDTVVQDAVDRESNQDIADDAEDALIDYIFVIPAGDTNIHKAARDLLRLIQHPFSDALELIPEGNELAPPMQTTLVNWSEAAVGSPQEWVWELQHCDSDTVAVATSAQQSCLRIFEVMSKSGPGRFVGDGDKSSWTTWAPAPF